MRYYQDIEPGETLQAGDERMSGNSREWVPVYSGSIGQPVPADLLAFYRRPVNLPVLQRVTLEAMAELKDQETPFILFRHKEEPAFRFERAEYSKLAFMWLNAEGYEINPFDWQWFIVPSTIPEVQQ